MRKTHARLYVRTRQDPCPRAYACSALLGPSSGALAAPHRMAAIARFAHRMAAWGDGQWRLIWIEEEGEEVDHKQALQGLQAQSSTPSTIEHFKATQDLQAQSSTTKCFAKHDQAPPQEQRFGNFPATRHGVSEKGSKGGGNGDQPGASMREPWLLDEHSMSIRAGAQRHHHLSTWHVSQRYFSDQAPQHLNHADPGHECDAQRRKFLSRGERNRQAWRDSVPCHIRQKFKDTQSLLDDVGVHWPVRGDDLVPPDADPAYVTYVP